MLFRNATRKISPPAAMKGVGVLKSVKSCTHWGVVGVDGGGVAGGAALEGGELYVGTLGA